jgi:hypothetical protein
MLTVGEHRREKYLGSGILQAVCGKTYIIAEGLVAI